MKRLESVGGVGYEACNRRLDLDLPISSLLGYIVDIETTNAFQTPKGTTLESPGRAFQVSDIFQRRSAFGSLVSDLPLGSCKDIRIPAPAPANACNVSKMMDHMATILDQVHHLWYSGGPSV